MIAANARVLAIVVARIGDTLLATPALRALRAACPAGELTVLAHPARREVLENLAFIDHLGSITKTRAPWRGRLTRRRYDCAVVYGHDAPLVRYALRAAQKVVAFRQAEAALNARLYAAVPPPSREHAVKERLRLCQALGVTTDNMRLSYSVTADEAAAARARLDAQFAQRPHPLVGLQLQSFPTKAYRDWPPGHFRELLTRLYASRPEAGVVILGDAVSRRAADGFVQDFPGRCISFAGRLTLRETAAVMAQLDLYIGVDTGPTHIAGALGNPDGSAVPLPAPRSLACPSATPASERDRTSGDRQRMRRRRRHGGDHGGLGLASRAGKPGRPQPAMSERRLHIVHMESSCGWGGQEIRTLTEAKGMMRRGHRITLVCPRGSADSCCGAPAGHSCNGAAHRAQVPGQPARPAPLAGTASRRTSTSSTPTARPIAGWWRSRVPCCCDAPPIVRTRHVSSASKPRPSSFWLYQRAARHVVVTGEAFANNCIATTASPSTDDLGTNRHRPRLVCAGRPAAAARAPRPPRRPMLGILGDAAQLEGTRLPARGHAALRNDFPPGGWW